MKKYLQIILISLIVSIVSIYVYYNHIPIEPIKILQIGGEQMLGISLTTIQATDKIKDSRTTINNNFTALNIGKIEISTTTLPLLATLNGLTSASSLVTVGTIGTGVWNATVLTVAYGGTGSTTLSSNQVLLGNGTGILKTVTGFGTSGQFLTSTGNGTAPTWQTSAVDTGIAYNWTGLHSFSATTSLATTTQYGIMGGLMPVGSITAYATTTAPQGWLACDGASKSTTIYADLFAVIGYSYGGSGANFNLPNLNGRNIIGYGSATTTFDTMGEMGGEDEHLLSEAEMPSHTHTYVYGNDASPGPSATNGGDETDATTGATGGDTAHNIMDPFIVLRYIIKY